MARGDCIVDLSPRWIVAFRKGNIAFSIPFNNVDEMTMAIARAKAAGYNAKTFPAKARG
jgi:hypothetical protein